VLSDDERRLLEEFKQEMSKQELSGA